MAIYMQSIYHFCIRSNGGQNDLTAVLGKTTLFFSVFNSRIPKTHKMMYNTLLGKVIDWETYGFYSNGVTRILIGKRGQNDLTAVLVLNRVIRRRR